MRKGHHLLRVLIAVRWLERLRDRLANRRAAHRPPVFYIGGPTINTSDLRFRQFPAIYAARGNIDTSDR
jgi:hypothetical protein